ncbi:MAG: hypothetical protein J7L78_00840 [Dehalococcoidales bacterium]|nr:hypothetical protein [Dehalococcoidales bacterium]
MGGLSQAKVAETMGISARRVYQILKEIEGPSNFISQVITNLLGASKFIKDKQQVKEAVRLYRSGMSQAVCNRECNILVVGRPS